MSLLFDESGAELIADRMKAGGVNIHLAARVASINARDGHVESVALEDGETIAADVAGVAIGTRPAAAFLEGSGIELSNGVVVDTRLRTNVEGIFAAGDAAVIRSGAAMIPCRTWLTAAWQGDRAGRNMAGADETFSEPVFFNASHVYGFRYAVMGNFNPPPSPGIARARLYIPDGHLSVVAENGILSGATLIGDLAPAWALRRAIEHGRAADAAALDGQGIAALWRALDGEPRFL
ncbi:MAG: FAD-dependent oxidoreductase [Nitrospinae bacterium]|nr:FAD-dependent oxidoreductase [Nitrospinota bacterium]